MQPPVLHRVHVGWAGCPASRNHLAPMKIATFNINGIKARLPAFLDWLRDANADVVALQEIK